MQVAVWGCKQMAAVSLPSQSVFEAGLDDLLNDASPKKNKKKNKI